MISCSIRDAGRRVLPGVKGNAAAPYPRMNAAAFKRAARRRRAQGEQVGLF
jgi:hypothetical protein